MLPTEVPPLQPLVRAPSCCHERRRSIALYAAAGVRSDCPMPLAPEAPATLTNPLPAARP
eukprot:12817830-Alexandrium_andersonii.AAC.1